MSWVVDTLWSSIGKKIIMAVTGLSCFLFLIVHFLGNITLYWGGDLFTSYVEHIQALGPIITAAELGLLALAVIHVLMGTYLFYKNWMARPVRYTVNKYAGGRTIGSVTQPYTGIIILIFLIIHLLNFRFSNATDQTLFPLVAGFFANPLNSFLYILAMAVVAVHVSHGFWSAFQTLGANHPKYMPLVMWAGIAFSLIFGLGFGFIPVYLLIFA